MKHYWKKQKVQTSSYRQNRRRFCKINDRAISSFSKRASAKKSFSYAPSSLGRWRENVFIPKLAYHNNETERRRDFQIFPKAFSRVLAPENFRLFARWCEKNRVTEKRSGPLAFPTNFEQWKIGATIEFSFCVMEVFTIVFLFFWEKLPIYIRNCTFVCQMMRCETAILL